MKISVVIPAYNEENYIASCLDSLMEQTEKPDEIILVDNNCKDQTTSIAKQYDVKIVREERQGMIYARNRGFDSARYEIIARIDADTHPPPFWIKRIKENFERLINIEALVGPIIFYDLSFQTTLFSKLFIYSMNYILRHHTLIGPNMILKKKTWQKVKNHVCLDDKKVHEDIDLGIHVSAAGGIIHYDPLLVSYISGRRIKHNPLSFFAEYPIRVIKTLSSHRQ